jgi:uncharacterized protein YbgA (DUF1722 family)
MVYTYYEIGRLIVEEEQNGDNRAEYGEEILTELSTRLTKQFGKGFSVQNLYKMVYFFKIYSGQTQTISTKNEGADKEYLSSEKIIPNLSTPLINFGENENNESSPIQQTLSAELLSIENKQLAKKSDSEKNAQVPDFNLSWSHSLKLMCIPDPSERRFYEIEAEANNWSLRELERQFDTSLYERLALSRNKEGVRALAEKGQIIEKPHDLPKAPYILDFRQSLHDCFTKQRAA